MTWRALQGRPSWQSTKCRRLAAGEPTPEGSRRLRGARPVPYARRVRIHRILAAGRPVFSFEFFPPKTPVGTEQLLRALDDLKKLSPDFVSVTYGAMGSNRGQVLELVSTIKDDIGLNPMAHLSCTGHKRDEIAAILDQLAAAGIDNVLP